MSHSSRDNQVAAQLTTRLAEKGYRSLFLDFDPVFGIPAGRNWEKELYAQLRACRAVVVLCSRHWAASRWCFAEITHAKALGKHIIPIRLDSTPIDGLLTAGQVIDATGGWEEVYARLYHGLLSAGLDPDGQAWDPIRPPYPGLHAFEEADAGVFFGRNAEIRQGLDLLSQLQRFGGPRLVLVLGTSGSGKSSLVRAGLTPRLRRSPGNWLVLDAFRPLGRPLIELSKVLAAAFTRLGEPLDWQPIEGRLSNRTDSTADDSQVIQEQLDELEKRAGKRQAITLLVVDQCEELLVDGEETRRFMCSLAALLRTPGKQVIVLAALRSDFLGAFQQHPAMQGLLFESLPVGAMTQEGLAEIIAGPAGVAQIDLEPGLVPAILADTRTADALPLLAFTLRELWERFGEDGLLQVTEYRDELGGLEGSVARAAEAVLRAHVAETGRGTLEQGRVTLAAGDDTDLRKAFIAMVRVDEDGRFARRPALWSELPPDMEKLLARFIAARLLVERVDTQEVEVAHEALFRAWERLVGWLEDNREFLVWRRRLTEALGEWERRERHEAELLAGPALGEAHGWLRKHEAGQVQLTEGESEFIWASEEAAIQAKAAREQQLRWELQQAHTLAEVERRRLEDQFHNARRLKARFWVASTLAVIAAVMLIIAVIARAGAVSERNRAVSLRLVTQSLQVPNTQDDLGLLLGAEALRLDDNPDARAALFRRLQDIPQVHSIERVGGADFLEMALTGDGKLLATLTFDGRVQLWDVASGNSLWRLPVRDGDEAEVLDLAFGPDGRIFAVGMSDGTVQLWDVAARHPLGVLPFTEGWVVQDVDLVFSPDGRLLATMLNGGWVQLWDVRSRTALGTLLPGPAQQVADLAFSPDGKIIAVARLQRSVQLWDVATRSPLAELDPSRLTIGLDEHEGEIWRLAFSPDGKILAMGTGFGNVQFWDVTARRPLQASGKGHNGRVEYLSYSREGSLLASGWGDRVQIWNGRGADRPILSLRVPTRDSAQVGSLAFNPDESLLILGRSDGAVLTWNMVPSGPLGSPLLAPASESREVVLSPKAKLLARMDPGGIQLWDLETRRRLGNPLPAQTGDYVRFVFSPDERLLASAGPGGVVQRWDLTTRLPLPGMKTGSNGSVVGLAFSPDGKRLAVSGTDGSFEVREARSGRGLWKRSTAGRDHIWHLAFDPRGSMLVSEGDSMLHLWDAETGRALGILRTKRTGEAPVFLTGDIFDLAFSPNGRHLAVADAQGVQLWDVTTSRLSRELTFNPQFAGRRLVFSPDGRMLASVGFESVQIWDMETGLPFGAPLPVPGTYLQSLAFDPSGQTLLSASTQGGVWRWRTSPETWIERACQIVGRDLTAAEWERFIGQKILPRRERTCAGTRSPSRPGG